MDFNDIKMGPGFWKMNVSHLSNEIVQQTIRSIWKKSKLELMENNSNKMKCWMEFQENIATFLQEWGKSKAMLQNVQFKQFQQNLANLRIQYQQNKSEEIRNQMEDLQNQIRKIEEYKMEGARIRAKVFQMEMVEKPTKYFFARAQMRKSKTIIKKLKSDNGKIAQGLALLEVVKRYYNNLYSKKKTSIKAKEQILGIIKNKLDQKLSYKLGLPLSIEELQKATNELNNGKSPGYTGISVEFYKQFPEILEGLLLVWKDGLEKGITPNSFQLGIINLIFKKGDQEEITNYRPITLLNVDYKIIAKSYANRLKQVIGNLVGKNQRGFIPGRDIRSNIMESILALEIAKRKKLSGAMILWDFEKAFDRLDREFLWSTMEQTQMGTEFIKSIQLLHWNSQATILVNGYFTNIIKVESGVRQGCPIAPMLFALSSEPLRAAVEYDTQFTGLQLDDIRLTLQMFADDTNGFITSELDYQRINYHLEMYQQASGHKLNIKKSVTIPFGNFDTTILQPLRILDKMETESLLGVKFGWIGVPTHSSIELVTNKFKCKLEKWKCWPMSMYGRSLISKVSMASHLWYVAQFLDSKDEDWKEVWNLYWKFIFQGSIKCKIAYKDAIKKRINGGIGAINLKLQIQALQIHWIVRMYNNQEENWSKLFQKEIQRLAELFNCGNNWLLKSWPEDVVSQGLIGKAIYGWSKLDIQQKQIDGKMEIGLTTTNGKFIQMNKITVSSIYQQLVGQDWNKVVVESSRCLWTNNIIRWEDRWKYLNKVDFLSPKDKEFKHNNWIGKLWTGNNRLSTKYPDLLCSICLDSELDRNHPIGMECKFAKKLFNRFRRCWQLWTHSIQSKKEIKQQWKLDWTIGNKFGNQMDFAMNLLKRKIWAHYTKCIIEETDPISKNQLWVDWIYGFKWNLESIIIKYKNNPQQLEFWSMNGYWIILNGSNGIPQVNNNSFYSTMGRKNRNQS